MKKCRVISHPSQLQEADLYEYRFDRFPFKKEHIRYPCIFTLRPQDQGGSFEGSARAREKRWHEILSWNPTYRDLEYNAPFSLPGKKLISYHNLEKTPKELPIYDKVACKAHSINDALRLLKHGKEHSLLALAMGEHGLLTRLFAQPWTYVADDLITDEELALYDITKPLFGLIGGTVHQSPSHRTHNKCGVCYVKMAVQPEELSEFFQHIHLFKGLSVTIPLKEAVLPFVEADAYAQEVGAVNTILVRDKLYGYNTDGVGALDALGSVKGKRVLVFGAGGSAKAVAYEAKKRGGDVAIFNRTQQKAETLAKILDVSVAAPNAPYDVLINTTPMVPHLIPSTTILDIKLNPPSYLKEAQKQNIRVVHAFEMFINQAIEQFKIWFSSEGLAF
ncbi:MAG: type I 3-dehydroquinate dehydratase [Chlamydiales bacterium]|nr:type I 3-dehydroquinate dehydratase [Chlamydiales bacterium]